MSPSLSATSKDLLHRLRQPRIEAAFLLHRRHAAVLVVVARAQHGVTGQGEDLVVDVSVEQPGITWGYHGKPWEKHGKMPKTIGKP